MGDGLCIFDHGDEPRQVDVGLLCEWHRRRMTFLTNGIHELWLDLALITEAGSAPKDETPKTKHLKSAEAPAPANLEALALRDPRSSTVRLPTDESTPIPPVLFVVASWLLCLAEERPLTADLPASVLAQLAVLSRHHDWIAAQTWVDDYIGEMTELHKALKAAVRDQTHRTIGYCHLSTEERERCGGALVQENGSSVVRCRGCEASWVTSHQRAMLAITLDAS